MLVCFVDRCKNPMKFKFPVDTVTKHRWLTAIRKPTHIPKKYHGLCSVHFKTEQFIEKSFTGGFKLHRKKLRKDAVPCIFEWNVAEVDAATETVSDNLTGCAIVHSEVDEQSETNVIFDVEEEFIVATTPEIPEDEHVNEAEKDFVMDTTSENSGDGFVNSEVDLQPDETEIEDLAGGHTLRKTPTPLAMMLIEKFRDRPDVISYYTGLESYSKFMTVLYSLGRKAHRLKYRNKQVLCVSVPDQFFITLWKLRRNCADFELGVNFGVCRATISIIIYTWITFVAHQWSKIQISPSKELVQYYMPPTFRKNYPSTRVIIDGTEIYTERPQNPRTQQSTFSTYKHRNTVKDLIGATPGGFITHHSTAYGGSTSDRQIIERSSLLNDCEPGDSIMADRGFNVQDIFAPKDIQVNIPTFLKGKGSLPSKTVLNDRRLSKHRVHIERVIGLAKTYNILHTTLSHHHVHVATEICSVIIMLCNFRESVMQKGVKRKL